MPFDRDVRVFTSKQLLSIGALLNGPHAREVMGWLYQHYRVQVVYTAHDSRDLEVPHSLTKEDAAVIVSELQVLYK